MKSRQSSKLNRCTNAVIQMQNEPKVVPSCGNIFKDIGCKDSKKLLKFSEYFERVKKFNCKFFQNFQCKYFPCHKGIEEKDFNCLLCYCPLFGKGFSTDYTGDWHGRCRSTTGRFQDCMNCTFPHEKKNYSKIIRLLKEWY